MRLGMCGPKGCVLQTEVCREAAKAGNCSPGPACSGHKQGDPGAGGRGVEGGGQEGKVEACVVLAGGLQGPRGHDGQHFGAHPWPAVRATFL